MSQSKKRALRAAKESRGAGPFLAVPVAVLRSVAVASLSPHAAKLLWDIASQWRFGSNGDSGAAFESVMRPRGWRSKATLSKCLKELQEKGLIIQTRQGTLHKCSLYALGWLAIDDCGGKLEVQATRTPTGHWSSWKPPEKNANPSTPREPKTAKSGNLGSPRVLDG